MRNCRTFTCGWPDHLEKHAAKVHSAMTELSSINEPRAFISRRMMLAAFLLCVLIVNAFALGSLHLLQRDHESHQRVLAAALAETAEAKRGSSELRRVEEQKFRTERDLRIVLATMGGVSLL